MPRGFGVLSHLALGFGAPRQPILGTELSGVIDAIGPGVHRFKVGDPVFAFSGAGMGCYAEYKCMHEDGAIASKPTNLSYEQAAALSFGGTAALHFLRRAKLRGGESVLVNGASGSVGTAAIQLARHFGAAVTAVCSTGNLNLVASLGAAHVIDYTREDFAASGKRYDVILDTAGTAPFSRSRNALKDGGRLLLVLRTLPDVFTAPWFSHTTLNQVIGGVASERAEDLHFLAKLAEAGKYTPVVDRCYRFDQIVEAHRYVDTGHKRGNVILTF